MEQLEQLYTVVKKVLDILETIKYVFFFFKKWCSCPVTQSPLKR